MFTVIDKESQLRVEIAEARYLIHFREHFPTELLDGDEIDEQFAENIEKVVDECIEKNDPYPVPDDYDERLY